MTPIITQAIIAVTVLVSILAENNRSIKERLVFNPYLVHHSKQYYRLITHAFIHSGWMHLLVNMYVLYSFGKYVELTLRNAFPNNGVMAFLLLYFGGIVFASLSAYFKHKDNPRYNALGASGAVAAILYAFIIISPVSGLSLYFMISMPAFVFGFLYLWYEYKMDQRGKGRIAHDAHFYGAIYGVVFMAILDFQYLIDCGKDIQFYIMSFFGG